MLMKLDFDSNNCSFLSTSALVYCFIMLFTPIVLNLKYKVSAKHGF